MQLGKLRERLKELMRHPATPTEYVYGYVVKAWDADSGQYEPVSGYVVDPVHKTVELTTDDDGYEVNLGIPAARIAPAEQPSDFDGWERYWASLDADSQEKLTSSVGLEGARAWFGIGAVWGKEGGDADVDTSPVIRYLQRCMIRLLQ